MKKLSFVSVVLAFGLFLSACSHNDVELQKEGTGTDQMLKSPCACLQIDYTSPTFQWVM